MWGKERCVDLSSARSLLRVFSPGDEPFEWSVVGHHRDTVAEVGGDVGSGDIHGRGVREDQRCARDPLSPMTIIWNNKRD